VSEALVAPRLPFAESSSALVRVATLEQERSHLTTPRGDKAVNYEDEYKRHSGIVHREQLKAKKLSRPLDDVPTSQYTLSHKWLQLSDEIVVAEASADKHLDYIAAFECQHLMDTFAKRLPRELRNSVYQWLVPTGTYECKSISDLKALPKIDAPKAMPRAKSCDGFSFLMFHYMEGNHLSEILEHWYRWTTFSFKGGGFTKYIGEMKPLGNQISPRDLIRNVKFNLDTIRMTMMFARRYNVPAENPNPSNGSNINPCHVVIQGLDDVFYFDPLTKVHVRFFRAPYFYGPSHADLEEFFEGIWGFITRVLEKGHLIDMYDSDGSFIPDMVTPSPKTWTNCFLDVSIVSTLPQQDLCELTRAVAISAIRSNGLSTRGMRGEKLESGVWCCVTVDVACKRSYMVFSRNICSVQSPIVLSSHSLRDSIYTGLEPTRLPEVIEAKPLHPL
jgi:hypothetical protein